MSSVPPNPDRGPQRWPVGWAAALLVIALGALLYLPHLGTSELDNEEGRRAIPAREMLASGDWVLPTVWGQPYLTKPPLLYWCIAAAGSLRGEVDEFATRLPSVLATIATALVLLAFGARTLGRNAGLCAALCYLLSGAAFGKGSLGEIEALLALCVLGSTAFAWLAFEGSWAAVLPAGLSLGAALLAKGPAALLFHFALLSAFALSTRRPRALLSPRAWGPLLLGTALALVWVLALRARPDAREALAVWSRELDRGGGSFQEAVIERLKMPFEAVLGYLPATLCLLLGWRDGSTKAALRHPLVRAALWGIAIGLFLLELAGAARHRYAYPLLPWAALAGGAVAARWVELERAGPELSALRWAVRALGAAGIALGLLGPILWLVPLGRMVPLDALGWLITLAAAGIGLALLARMPGLRPRTWLLLAAAILALGRVDQITQLVPQRAHRLGRVETAARLDALLPAGEPLYTDLRSHHNLLYYLRRPVRGVESLQQVRPGAFALVEARELGAQRGDASAFERLLEEKLEGKHLVLLQVESRD